MNSVNFQDWEPVVLKNKTKEQKTQQNTQNQPGFKEYIRLVEDDAWRIGLSELISEHNKSGLVDSEIYNSLKGVEAFSKFIDNVINGDIKPGKEPLIL